MTEILKNMTTKQRNIQETLSLAAKHLREAGNANAADEIEGFCYDMKVTGTHYDY
jgi:hypothetical protein